MRCLTNPVTYIPHFYGILCCDCAIGYIAVPEHFLIGDDDETYGMNDESESSVTQNGAYRPKTRVGISCYDESSIAVLQSSIMSCAPFSDDEGEATMEDPDISYYKHFDTSDSNKSDQTFHPSILEMDRKVLSSGDANCIAIRRSLTRYQSNIRAVKDLDQKKQLVDEYEKFKSKYDIDNEDDAIKASHYLDNARNNGFDHPNEKRLVFYQKAIAYTNDLQEKNDLKLEYRRFCFSIKSKPKEETNETI